MNYNRIMSVALLVGVISSSVFAMNILGSATHNTDKTKVDSVTVETKKRMRSGGESSLKETTEIDKKRVERYRKAAEQGDVDGEKGQVCIASRGKVKKLCTEVKAGASADVSIRALRGSGGL